MVSAKKVVQKWLKKTFFFSKTTELRIQYNLINSELYNLKFCDNLNFNSNLRPMEAKFIKNLPGYLKNLDNL
jgi:hypothetical protein